MSATPTTPRTPLSLTDLIHARLEAAVVAARPWPRSWREPNVYGGLDLAARPSRRLDVDGEDGEGRRWRRRAEGDDDPRSGLALPAFVVVCTADQAGRNLVPDPDTGGVLQRVTSTVLIHTGVPARNDPGGIRGTADTRLDHYVAFARRHLLAWAPDGQFPAGRWAPLELRGGRIDRLHDGRAWWIDTWETHRLMRGAPPPEAPGVVPSTVHSRFPDPGDTPATADDFPPPLAGAADC